MGEEEEEEKEEEVGEKLVQRKRRQSSKKGCGGGLLPFTLVSPMLVSLIVIFAIKRLKNLATINNDRSYRFF